MTDYPDISDLIERKRMGRERAAARSFAEKIAWLERARADLEPLRKLRLAAEAARGDTGDSPPASKSSRSTSE